MKLKLLCQCHISFPEPLTVIPVKATVTKFSLCCVVRDSTLTKGDGCRVEEIITTVHDITRFHLRFQAA